MTDSPGTTSARLVDLKLARQVLNGSRVAREQFAERMRCIPAFLTAANARFGRPFGPEDLADLSQDVLITVWQKLETFSGQATLETWTWRFCQFEFSNRARKRFRRRALAGPPIEEMNELEGPGEPVADVEYDDLEQGLQALGPPAEEIIRLKHYDHLTFDEIAERIGISPNTAKTRYYRGMAWLRRHLDREVTGERS
ncbi:MAG: sigma-70 family RNA polymerase sigma factor [Planctomycetota bacterium]